jgi:hypothetical protein
MLVQYACSDVADRVWPDLQRRYSCGSGHEMVFVSAVECREYKATCHSCRYSRWTGQSMADANSKINSHCRRNPTHKGTVDYLAYPKTVKEFKLRYGNQRKVKKWIVNDPTRSRRVVPLVMAMAVSRKFPNEPPF